jgi:hypothetical protein
MPKSCFRNKLLQYIENSIKGKRMVAKENINKSRRSEPATRHNNIIKLDIACSTLNLQLNFPNCLDVAPEKNFNQW